MSTNLKNKPQAPKKISREEGPPYFEPDIYSQIKSLSAAVDDIKCDISRCDRGILICIIWLIIIIFILLVHPGK